MCAPSGVARCLARTPASAWPLRHVAAAVKVVRDSGLPNHTDALFTTIEGEWDEGFEVARRATEAVAPFGSRVSLVLKADIRPGYTGELDAKVERLDAALARAEDA